jgi:hypothetical protein
MAHGHLLAAPKTAERGGQPTAARPSLILAASVIDRRETPGPLALKGDDTPRAGQVAAHWGSR